MSLGVLETGTTDRQTLSLLLSEFKHNPSHVQTPKHQPPVHCLTQWQSMQYRNVGWHRERIEWSLKKVMENFGPKIEDRNIFITHIPWNIQQDLWDNFLYPNTNLPTNSSGLPNQQLLTLALSLVLVSLFFLFLLFQIWSTLTYFPPLSLEQFYYIPCSSLDIYCIFSISILSSHQYICNICTVGGIIIHPILFLS